ncbi:MAG: hypothetical protein GY736_25000, partial [Sphingomonas sp.]|uniref:glycosyl hydrolase family 28-related protein n=1 Tax=Sphingomonas sp. TaxID=28214 RepID=UPI00258AF44C
MLATTAVALLAPVTTRAAPARSVLATAPNEPRAVTVSGAKDGRADATAAIQRAIDAARITGGNGIVFLPSGRYRLSRSILV